MDTKESECVYWHRQEMVQSSFASDIEHKIDHDKGRVLKNKAAFIDDDATTFLMLFTVL